MIKFSKLLIVMLIVIYSPMLNGDSAVDRSVLRVGIDTFPDSLNPVYSTDETSVAICNKVYDALFLFDCKGKISNCLAHKATFEEKDGNMSVMVELKKKIFFSDGKELEADDVVETVKLLQNREFKYPYRSNVKLILKVDKLDKYRVRFHLNKTIASWRNYLTFKILNCRELRKASANGFRTAQLSGTGPYKIKEIKEQSRILLQANSNYNRGAEQKMYRFIKYELVAYTQLAPLKLLADELDICELQPESVRAYRKLEEWKRKFHIIKYKKFGYTYLVFNLNNSHITRNIRYHFYNLLYGGFTKNFLAGTGELVFTPFLLLNSGIKPTPLKTEALKAPVTLRILCNSKSKLRKGFVLFLRDYLKPMGINLKPIFIDYHTFLEYIKKGKYDLAVSGFLLDIDYDMKDIFHSEAYFNYANYKSSEMDRLLEEGLIETDTPKREQLYLRAHNIWLDQLPLLPLFNLYYYKGVSRAVKVPDQTYQMVGSTGDFLNNIQQWPMGSMKPE